MALSDLKKILTELKEKKAVIFGIDSKTSYKKAHTPVVIKAKKKEI